MRTCNILLIAVVQVVFCRVREPLTIQTSKLGNLVSTTDSLKTTIKSTESHSSKAGNNQHQPSGGKSAPCESGSNFEEYLSEHVEHFAKWYEKSKHNNSGNKTKERPKSTKNTTTAKAKNTRRLLRRTVSPPTSPKINPKILYSFTNSNTYIKILVKFHFCTSVHSRDERRSTADAIINELNAAFKSSAFLFMSDGGDIGWGSSDVDPKLFENALKNSETSYELKHTVRTSEYARKELGKVNPTLLHVYIVNKWHNEDSTTTLGRSTFPQVRMSYTVVTT